MVEQKCRVNIVREYATGNTNDCTITVIIVGAVSPDTAYVVDDYPYGFRLRCKIRYWLEYKKGHGVREVSQTTNPKKAGEVWNKPKAGTYCNFGMCLYLKEDGHVHAAGLGIYSDHAEAKTFYDTYKDGIPPEMLPELVRWIEGKRIYEEKMQQGLDYVAAGKATVKELVNKAMDEKYLADIEADCDDVGSHAPDCKCNGGEYKP